MLGTTRFLSERDGKSSLTSRDILKQLFDDDSGFSESDSGGGDVHFQTIHLWNKASA